MVVARLMQSRVFSTEWLLKLMIKIKWEQNFPREACPQNPLVIIASSIYQIWLQPCKMLVFLLVFILVSHRIV